MGTEYCGLPRDACSVLVGKLIASQGSTLGCSTNAVNHGQPPKIGVTPRSRSAVRPQPPGPIARASIFTAHLHGTGSSHRRLDVPRAFRSALDPYAIARQAEPRIVPDRGGDLG